MSYTRRYLKYSDTSENNRGLKYYKTCIGKDKNICKLSLYLKKNAIDYGMNYKENYDKKDKPGSIVETSAYGINNIFRIPSLYKLDVRKNHYKKDIPSELTSPEDCGCDDKDTETINESLALRQLYTNKYYDFKTKLLECHICDEIFEKTYLCSLDDLKDKIKDSPLLNSFDFIRRDIKSKRYTYLYLALKNLVENKIQFKNGYNIEGYLIMVDALSDRLRSPFRTKPRGQLRASQRIWTHLRV